MTKTLTQLLDEACSRRGQKWIEWPDEPVSSPPYERWWGCVYDPLSGGVAALVTNSGNQAVRRRLLELLDAPPPKVASVREGTVVRHEDSLVTLDFAGTRETVAHPFFVPVRVGMAVKAVEFEGHDGPVLFWGHEHIPRRLTERPLGSDD